MNEEDKMWVVVETTYPTYNLESELARLRQTYVEACDEVYYTYEEACIAAKETRADSCYFDEDNFKDDDEPPFDSATLETLDNDDQVLIEVMTVGEFKKQKEAIRRECLKLTAAKRFEELVETKMRERKAANSKRVYYCFPVWDDKGHGNVPAELEIDDATNTESLKDLDRVKSLMYKPKTDIDYSKENVLFQVLSKCARLEELHLHMASQKGWLSDEFINGLISSQPALPGTLAVLSMQSCSLSPDGMKALARFSSLDHLDIMCAFAYELAAEAKMNSAFMDEPFEAPYEGALSEICLKLVGQGRLMRLDLGYGHDWGMVNDLVGSTVKWEIARALASKGGRGLTMTENRDPPEEWSSALAEDEATRLVLQEVANQEDDPHVAKLAKKRLSRMMERKRGSQEE